MALTIYKLSEYVNWRASGGATYMSGGGMSGNVPPTDLSNYYTKSELQTEGTSIVNFGNLINLPFIYSIEETSAGDVQLVNDEDEPGVNKVYGTDEFGSKGWWDQVTGGGEVGISGVAVADQVAVWASADHIGGSAGLTYDGSTLHIDGNVNLTGGIATGDDFALSSDRKLKKNIKEYVPEPMEVIYRQFEMKTQPGQMRYGVIAQELEKVYPELVRNSNGTLSVSYFDLLIREIAYLKQKVAELEVKLNG